MIRADFGIRRITPPWLRSWASLEERVCPSGESPMSICDALGCDCVVSDLGIVAIGRPRHGLQCHTFRLRAWANVSFAQVVCHLRPHLLQNIAAFLVERLRHATQVGLDEGRSHSPALIDSVEIGWIGRRFCAERVHQERTKPDIDTMDTIIHFERYLAATSRSSWKICADLLRVIVTKCENQSNIQYIVKHTFLIITWQFLEEKWTATNRRLK